MTTSDVDADQVFAALADDDCQALLAACATTARTVPELANECDIPTATIYRKVETLVQAGLLEETTRIRTEGRNVSEYALRVTSIHVVLGESDEIACIIEADDRNRESEQSSSYTSVEMSTDGGKPVVVEDDREPDLGTLFEKVTGTTVVVDSQKSGPTSRCLDDETPVSDYLTRLARDDGLSDTYTDSGEEGSGE